MEEEGDLSIGDLLLLKSSKLVRPCKTCTNKGKRSYLSLDNARIATS